MMVNGRKGENDNPPFTFPVIQNNNDCAMSIPPNERAAQCMIPGEGNGAFESFHNMPLAGAATRENTYSVNQSYARGIADTGGNLMIDFMTTNSLQNPMIDLNCGTTKQSLAEVPLLPEWNMKGIPQGINQAYRAIADDAMNNGAGLSNFQNPQPNRQLMIARNLTGDCQMSRQGGGKKFENISRLQKIGDRVSLPFPFRPQDSGPADTGYNVNSNATQYGFQGKVEGTFLSLGIGGTEEAISRPKRSNREVSNIGYVHQAIGQNLADGSTGLQRNANGSYRPLFDVDRHTASHNDVGVLNTPNGGPGCSPYNFLQTPQNNMQLSMSTPGDSNSNAVGNRNVRCGDLGSYRPFGGNQVALSGTLGSHSARFCGSRQQDMYGLTLEVHKPWWSNSHTPSEQIHNVHLRTANTLGSEYPMNFPSVRHSGSFTRQNYAEQQPFTDNRTAIQVVGSEGAGNHGAQAATDSLFPKRLGVEFHDKGSSQAGQRDVFPKGISMQTTAEIFQPPDNKGSSGLPDHLLQHSVTDQTEGVMPIRYQLNSQGPFSNTGQYEDTLVQLSTHPQGVAAINASTVDGLSQRSDFYSRPSLKRIAVAPPPASHWVQRQKIAHPTVHPSIAIPPHTKSYIPLTNIHPSVPILSQTNPHVPVTAPVHPSVAIPSQIKPHIPAPAVDPSIPCPPLIKHSVATAPFHHALAQPSLIKPPISATTAYAAAHIKWQDPAGIPQVTGHKCLLCKRDLSYASEGRVYQPTTPPPVAVLPCGHTFHDQCLQNITPQDQSKEPPCIPCAIGDN